MLRRNTVDRCQVTGTCGTIQAYEQGRREPVQACTSRVTCVVPGLTAPTREHLYPRLFSGSALHVLERLDLSQMAEAPHQEADQPVVDPALGAESADRLHETIRR